MSCEQLIALHELLMILKIGSITGMVLAAVAALCAAYSLWDFCKRSSSSGR